MKSVIKVAAAAAACFAMGACAYNAPVSVSPNLNVYSSYGEKIHGQYLLFVDDGEFVQDVHPTGQACSFHHFPVDIRDTFKTSVLKTVEQLVDGVQLVDAPVASTQLAAQGKAGMIIVKAENFGARIIFIPGFWSATAESNVDLSANISVDGQTGRLLGTSASGSGNAQSGAGGACGGGALAVGEATEKAIKQVLGQLGERLSNSPRLRAGAAAAR